MRRRRSGPGPYGVGDPGAPMAWGTWAPVVWGTASATAEWSEVLFWPRDSAHRESASLSEL